VVAGTGRFCTRVMTALGDRALVKTGAEGVFIGAIKELGLGIALKIDDGAGRASEAAMARILIDLLKLTPDDPGYAEMRDLANPQVKSWAGDVVGEIRVTEALDGVTG